MTRKTPASCLFILSLCVALPSGSQAAEFEGNVPLALVKALLQNPASPEVHIYPGIPDNFPRFDLPAGFTVLGGLQLETGQRLALTTLEDGPTSLQRFSNALITANFVEIPQASRGFSPSLLSMQRQLFCRDDVGFLTVIHTTGRDANLLTLGTSNPMGNPDWQGCETAINPQPPQSRSPLSGRPPVAMETLLQYMPVLELPVEQNRVARSPFLGSGGSGSGNGMHYQIDIDFSSDKSVDEIYQHFAVQVLRQQWSGDGDTVGTISATGNFIRVPDQTTYLHGNLSILQTSTDSFTVSFRVTKLNPE